MYVIVAYNRPAYTPASSSWEWGAISTSMFSLEGQELLLPPVTLEDFEKALSKGRSTVSSEEMAKYEEVRNKLHSKITFLMDSLVFISLLLNSVRKNARHIRMRRKKTR